MRPREPLNGIKLASGHWLFHFAFLLGSLLAVKTDFDDDKTDDVVPNSEFATQGPNIVQLLRFVHAYVIVS